MSKKIGKGYYPSQCFMSYCDLFIFLLQKAERNKLATLARLKLKLDFSKGRAYFQRRSLAVCFCKRSSNKIIPGRNIDLLTSSATC